ATAVLRHEVDDLGRDLVRRADQVALVLAVLVIHHHDQLAGAEIGEGPLDRCSRHRRTSAPSHALAIPFRYFPTRSPSRCTLAPATRWPSVVCANVCGTMDTWTTPGSTTALTVSDTPSTAREPSGMVTATTSSGSSISISTASSRRATLRTLPTPSTCPCTQCPPSRSPTLSARSRLTASPTDLLPNVVRGSDVATTFTAKRESLVRSTVRHAPST